VFKFVRNIARTVHWFLTGKKLAGLSGEGRQRSELNVRVVDKTETPTMKGVQWMLEIGFSHNAKV